MLRHMTIAELAFISKAMLLFFILFEVSMQ